MRLHPSRRIVSRLIRKPRGATVGRSADYSGSMTDPVIEQIEAFRCRRGSLAAERRNRGYTLYNARSGTAVARLRTTDTDVLHWSLWKERWIAGGPLGPAQTLN